jgi:hypothetical protein
MFSFNIKRQKTVASLFCLSLLLVVTVSCGGAPVINLASIVSSGRTVVALINVSEKLLYVLSNLVNVSYEGLGEDIGSESFRTNSKFSNEIIEKMEAQHLELVAKHKELDDSLDKTNTAANELFSMLETRAKQNSRTSLRDEQLRNISAKKETFSEKIEVAEGVSSKLKASIKEYDNILNVFQVNVGLNEAQKYIETVDSVTSQYKLLDQEVQVALREGRQIITSIADVPSQSPEASVPTPSNPTDQNPDATVPSSVPQSPQTTASTPTPGSNVAPQQADRPILGVKIVSLTEELRQQINQNKSSNLSIDVDKGVLVVEVEQDYPAAKAGIQIGDVIVKVNARTVVDANEFLDEIKKMQAGMELPLEIYRGEQKLEVLVYFK